MFKVGDTIKDSDLEFQGKIIAIDLNGLIYVLYNDNSVYIYSYDSDDETRNIYTTEDISIVTPTGTAYMSPKYRAGNEVVSTCGKYRCLIVEVKAHTYLAKALNYKAMGNREDGNWETHEWERFERITRLLTPLEKLI